DEYRQCREEGKSPSVAITSTIRHLFVPLLASTATTILTFLPLVIMPGNAGEFVSTLGIAVVLSIICSLFLSLSVVPAISGWVDSRWVSPPGQGGMWRNGIHIDFLYKRYRRAVTFTLRYPLIGIFLGVALPISGFVLSTLLVNQFFPPVDRDQFQIQIKLPTQSSIYQAERLVKSAREILHAHPEVLRSHWFLGEQPPRVYYNVTISEDGSARYASAFVDTRSAEDTRRLLPRLQREMIDAFPEATILTLPFEQGPPIESPISVRLYGPDVGILAQLGDKIRLILSRTSKVTFAEDSISRGQPKLVVRPDEDAARIAGFSLTDIAIQLEGALDGVTGGTILEGTEEVPVRVRIASEERTTLSRIAAGYLSSPADQARNAGVVPGVPLGAIADIELAPSVATVTRRHGERINTVRAYLEPFSLTGASLNDFKTRLKESDFKLPTGYRIEYGGESEGSGEARINLLSVFAPLLVLMVSTLVLAFNSFRMAMITGSVAFLAVGCGLAAVWGFAYPLGFMAIIGTMGLIGIAINDSIVVLAALRADDSACTGDIEASVNVVMKASRHVISTTFTTIGGFTPLIIWGGSFWPPLAVAVAGGMIGATLLALFFVPAFFLLLSAHGHKKRLQTQCAM
ncbi:MAG: efflux RND transporter permease subunit, partial [Pseudomonadota bacterium]